MSHEPFIWAAYTVGAIVYLWCALAPVARRKKVLGDVRRLVHYEERSGDPNP